jgi:hypothetical protein
VGVCSAKEVYLELRCSQGRSIKLIDLVEVTRMGCQELAVSGFDSMEDGWQDLGLVVDLIRVDLMALERTISPSKHGGLPASLRLMRESGQSDRCL